MFGTFSIDTNGRASTSAFGYAATEEKKHRRRVSPTTRSEDDELKPSERRKLKALADDLRRNFEVPAFGLRLHLDYVAGFTFRATSGVEAWDDALERFIATWSEPQNCDAAGRHSLDDLGRLWESHRTCDGDVGIFKLRDGRTQTIEGDRVKDPPDRKSGETWVHGVKINPQSAALAYAVHNRTKTGLQFGRTVPASWMYLHAYRDRYDQVRGVSPLAAAINRFRDVYEGFDLALSKSKVEQMFGLAIFRKYTEDDFSAMDTEQQRAARSASFRLDPEKPPYTLNLSAEDKVEPITSGNPSNEFQSFTKVMLRVGLLAFDIPDAFIDPIGLNFATMKTALTLYLKRCREKRRVNRQLRDHLTRWRIGLAIARGELDPSQYGLAFEDIRWVWVPHGIPYFDKGKEVPGDVAAINAGIQTLGDVIEERYDGTLETLLRRSAREHALAKKHGLVIPGLKEVGAEPAAPPGVSPKPLADDEEEEERKEARDEEDADRDEEDDDDAED